MKTTARITWWALVSLGLLLHCVSNSTAQDPDATTPKATTTIAPSEKTTMAITTTTAPAAAAAAATTLPITSATQPTTSPPVATTAAKTITTNPTTVTQGPSAKVTTTIGAGAPTTQTDPGPNIPGSTPSTLVTPTKQLTGTDPATTAPTVAAATSDDSSATVVTQNTSPGLPVNDSSVAATPSAAANAKQSTDGTSGNVISTALTTSPVKTTSRTPNPSGVTPSTIAVTEKKVTTSPVQQSTMTAPAAVSTTSKTITPPTPTTTTTVAAIETQTPKTISFTKGRERGNKEEKELEYVCTKLMATMHAANCTVTVRQHEGKTRFESVQIEGTVNPSLATQYYEEFTKSNTKKSGDNSTLIAILASCGALLVMIVGLAIYAHHRKPYNENQQHLTEELHTVENGYHDNPTLEVMEVQPEMQEKKMALNGEFNDSWIVPIDNLLKEDLPDEEDTHL